jgi:hypothetical protein
MMRKEWLLAAVAMAAGFLGGAISGGLGTAFAQDRSQNGRPREITAERFVVVDANGTTRAELGLDAQGRIDLTLYNQRRRVVWSAPTRGIAPVGPPIRVYPAGPSE